MVLRGRFQSMDKQTGSQIAGFRRIWPPLLAPAAFVTMGALTGWLWVGQRVWAVVLAVLCGALLWILWIIRQKNTRRNKVCENRENAIRGYQISGNGVFRSDWVFPAILCVLFLAAAGHQILLIRNGMAAGEQFANGIHVVEGRIVRLEPIGDDVWGQADIRLTGGGIFRLYGRTAHLLPGQDVRLTARFTRPSSVRNPGGFDEARSLASQGVFLKAELLLDRIQVTNSEYDRVHAAFIRMRSAIASSAKIGLPTRQAALLIGILIGDTRWMTAEEKRLFQESGLSHLTAVSGANVAFVLIPIVFILRKAIGKRKPRSVLTLLFLLAFGFLTGWEPSVTRAILMMGLMTTGRLVMRRSDPMNTLLFAGTVMLLAKPLLVVSSSFHLSFLATGGILLFSEPVSHRISRHMPLLPKPVLSLVSVNLAVQIAVLPLQTMLSRQLTPFSLLANLPAMPLAEGATLLGAAGLVPAGLAYTLLGNSVSVDSRMIGSFLAVAFTPARLLLDALTDLAAVFADPRWPRILTGPYTWMIAVASSLFVIACVAAGKQRILVFKAVAVLLASFVMLQATDYLRRPDLEVILLDVGQGDATLIRSRDGRTVLIDSGTENTGERVVKPALTALGIWKVDLLVLTHGHQDHAGGASGLMNAGRVKDLAVSQPAWRLAQELKTDRSDGLETDVMEQVLSLAQNKQIPVHQLKKGDTMPINQESGLRVLAPVETMDASTLAAQAGARGANAFSLILRLETDGGSMLMTGDCDRETEQSLLGDPGLDCSILRVAHHGSNATTSLPFLSGTTPDLAAISVGPNDYGHPAAALLERLSLKQVPVLRTDQTGAITIRFGNDRWTAHTWLRTSTR